MGGGVAWTKGSTLGFTRWSQEPFELSPVDLASLDIPVLPGQPTTGLLLRYRGHSLLVHHATAVASDDATKRMLELVGRSLDSVRKANKYFTAAATSSVRFYVGSEAERDQWLQLVLLNTQVQPPVAAPPAPLELPELPSTLSATPTPRRLNETINDGFQSLATAASCEDAKDTLGALAAYREAHALFMQVHPQLPMNKTRELIVDKCSEIQAIIDDLMAPRPATTTAEAPTPPPPAPSAADVPSSQHGIAAPPSAPPQMPASLDLDERLGRLQGFADSLQVEKARTEKSTKKSDLELRFAALKNEASRAPPLESLEARLSKLRGGTPSPVGNATAVTAIDVALEHALSGEDEGLKAAPLDRQVDDLITLVQQEIALGIQDDPPRLSLDSSEMDEDEQLSSLRQA
ncbi:hypothetical protein SPRG_10925 [Saprolegnia parasitica CBS 223.65]|uniref:Uncharacterized protein n=1 Tax=Saprolegnia parasitica (strain CBS 223.65) TaxID=695850 RepID=A0A067C5N5_SAPPC|nr:hypothetical protein SPRG_10925 [Saprolegnia parasitica CBS 223.65]KDO22107.1 hypothetical protein SPRG_10925 [Saprolegnia parasitica CBS 223.65]|eukprot:XP_012207147.1 hypothetical protein SPRG_10925 [Saprolegnia parasitica CBS 223.65]